MILDELKSKAEELFKLFKAAEHPFPITSPLPGLALTVIDLVEKLKVAEEALKYCSEVHPYNERAKELGQMIGADPDPMTFAREVLKKIRGEADGS